MAVHCAFCVSGWISSIALISSCTLSVCSVPSDMEGEQRCSSMWPVVSSFSAEFKMKVLATVTVTISRRHGHALPKQLSVTALVGDELESTESDSEASGDVICGSLTREDEGLWNEILNNLGKDLNKRARVLLQGLPEESDSEVDEATKQQTEVDIVCFTTGKAYTTKTFEQVVLPRFRQQVKQVSSETPSANKSLLDHYQHSPLIALANPDALLDALRSGSNFQG